ncbi:MAG: tetratricopeptide repeat protein [Rhodobacteraceae bacterium]|nr:tetratricopeptide repeat protein [Paracoccaceae bacterium]
MTLIPMFRRPNRLCALLLAACLLPSTPMLAQSNDDLRALRYYMQQGDQAAAQAELRRLRIAFPDWTPPSDLNELLAPESHGAVDEAAIWRQIERRDHDGARDLIDQGRRRVAGWTPPSDMLRVLETNEAQDSFDAATGARDATRAIAIARRSPHLMSCERINNAWLLADMYVLAGQKGPALTTYRNTVQSCPRYAQMQTTLEKASGVASEAEMRELFQVAHSANSGAKEQLDQLQRRLLGGGGGAAQTASQAPAESSAPAPSPQPASASAQPARPAPDIGSLPLRGDNRISEVRRLKEQEQYARCLAASQSPRSLDVLYERSWCAFGHDRPTEAMTGFQAAARAGDSLGANVRRDAHYGLALAYLSMNMTEQAAQVASQVRLNESQHNEVEAIVLDQRGVRAFRAGDYRQAVGYFNAMEDITGSLRRDLAILRAYAYLNSGQRGNARSEFERLHSQLATSETRQGLNAARGGP